MMMMINYHIVKNWIKSSQTLYFWSLLTKTFDLWYLTRLASRKLGLSLNIGKVYLREQINKNVLRPPNCFSCDVIDPNVALDNMISSVETVTPFRFYEAIKNPAHVRVENITLLACSVTTGKMITNWLWRLKWYYRHLNDVLDLRQSFVTITLIMPEDLGSYILKSFMRAGKLDRGRRSRGNWYAERWIICLSTLTDS